MKVIDPVTKYAINFAWVSGRITQLGVDNAVCTRSNPSSAAPPYWGRLDDSPEGRVELGKRIRTLFALTGGHIHGSDDVHLIKAWIAQEGLE